MGCSMVDVITASDMHYTIPARGLPGTLHWTIHLDMLQVGMRRTSHGPLVLPKLWPCRLCLAVDINMHSIRLLLVLSGGSRYDRRQA